MTSQVTFVIRDRSNEYSNFSFSIPPVDEVNWIETNTRVAAIQAAVAALTTGTIAKRIISLEEIIDDTQPINPYAQRELGLRMFYQETGGKYKKHHVTIPCPDLLVVDVTDKDKVDVENVTVVNALATAIEAAAVSPAGENIEFYRAKLVGRRN